MDTITATTADGTDLTATCQVTVAIPVPATGITLNKTTHSFTAANQTVTLTATVTPSNATNKSVMWTSSNTDVATVSSTGVVTAVADGTATITATTADGTNLSATCEVTVAIPVPATGITLNKTSHSFNAANQTVTLTATVTPTNATNKNVTWTNHHGYNCRWNGPHSNLSSDGSYSCSCYWHHPQQIHPFIQRSKSDGDADGNSDTNKCH